MERKVYSIDDEVDFPDYFRKKMDMIRQGNNLIETIK